MMHYTNFTAQKSSCVAHVLLFVAGGTEYERCVSCLIYLGSCPHAHVQQLRWNLSVSNRPNKMSISSLISSRWLFVCTRVNYWPPIKTVSTHFRGPEWALSGWHGTSLMSLRLWQRILPLFSCHHFPMSGHAARRGQMSRSVLEIKWCCASSTLDWLTEVASRRASVTGSQGYLGKIGLFLKNIHHFYLSSTTNPFRICIKWLKGAILHCFFGGFGKVNSKQWSFKRKVDLPLEHKCVLRVSVMSYLAWQGRKGWYLSCHSSWWHLLCNPDHQVQIR